MRVTLPRQIEVPDDTPIIDFIVKAHALGLKVRPVQHGSGLHLEPMNHEALPLATVSRLHPATGAPSSDRS